MNVPREVCRVLSIDGGGVRGLVAALVLTELERRAGAPISSLFDVVAGTSTGAVLALGLLCPDSTGGPRWTAAEMAEVYQAGGASIFRRTARRDLETAYGFLAPKYGSQEMETQLKARLGEVPLSAALRPLIVPTYDLARRSPHFFKSAPQHGDVDTTTRMWQVGMAAAAAPTYFTPVEIVDPEVGSRWLVDGGVVANNPTMCALAEVRRYRPRARALVLSVGCGSLSIDFATPRLRRGGALVWARPAFDITLDGQEDAVDHQMRQLLAEQDYWRFQAALPDDCERIDDGSLDNLRRLQATAAVLVHERAADLQAAADRLRSTDGVRT